MNPSDDAAFLVAKEGGGFLISDKKGTVQSENAASNAMVASARNALEIAQRTLGDFPNQTQRAAIIKVVHFVGMPLSTQMYVNKSFESMFFTASDAADIGELNILNILLKIIHPMEYCEFMHYMMYYRLIGDKKDGVVSWTLCANCVDRNQSVFPALLKFRMYYGETPEGLPNNFMPVGLAFSCEQLPACGMTRHSLPPPSQAGVISSLKRILQAGSSGLPPIDKSFKGHGAKGDPDFQSIGPPQRLVEIMLGISEGIENGHSIGPAVLTEMKSLIWNKAIAICLQRPEFAQAIFGQGTAPFPGGKILPIYQLLPVGYETHLKANGKRQGGQDGSGPRVVAKRGATKRPGSARPVKVPKTAVLVEAFADEQAETLDFFDHHVDFVPKAQAGAGNSDHSDDVESEVSYANSQGFQANLRIFDPMDDEDAQNQALEEMAIDIDVQDIDFDTDFLAMSGFC